jgi:hypothetical protein
LYPDLHRRADLATAARADGPNGDRVETHTRPQFRQVKLSTRRYRVNRRGYAGIQNSSKVLKKTPIRWAAPAKPNIPLRYIHVPALRYLPASLSA